MMGFANGLFLAKKTPFEIDFHNIYLTPSLLYVEIEGSKYPSDQTFLHYGRKEYQKFEYLLNQWNNCYKICE